MNIGYSRFRHLLNGFLAQRPELKRSCFYFFLGLAAGRSLLGGLAPFTAPMAVVAPFLSELKAWSLVGGLIIGTFIRGSTAGACTVLVVGLLSLRIRRNENWDSCLLLGLAAGSANFLINIFFYLVLGKNTEIFPGMIAESILAGLFTFPFLYTLHDLRVQGKEPARLLLLLVLVLCGLGDIRVGATQLGEIMVRGILLVAAGGWGAATGAAVGVVLGLLGGDTWQALSRTGFYAGTGFFTGLLKSMGRIGVMLGFLLANLLFSFYYGTRDDLTGHLMASGIAAGLYFIVSPFLEHILGKEQSRESDDPPLQAEIGFAQRAKPGEVLCGDSLTIAHPAPQRLLLAMSDGMGAGIHAARESRTVVKMLEQLIEQDTIPEVAAEVINTALFSRGDEESAATIDMVMVDLKAGHADFLKAGASPSFIKRGAQLEMVRSLCWPAGILENVETEVIRKQVLPGDLLVMATDGITEVDQDSDTPGDWLYTFLRDIPLDDAQAVADLVLKGALKNTGFQNRDDMTVLVARLSNGREWE